MICDANGVPLAARLTAANVSDITQLQPLVEAIPPLRGKRGRPRRRPKAVQADRAYDSQEHRRWLRGLGKTRWVVERTLSWLHQFRRLRIRW